MSIKLIVGLANPGNTNKPATTRVFGLSTNCPAYEGQSERREEIFSAKVARVNRPEGEVWLLKPDTFMNLSGKAVGALAQFYKILPEEILVVHDELDIPCGRIRFKLGGGTGGHNGLKDIQAKLGTPNFYRLRLGIDHPGDRNLVTAYVLNKPSADDRGLIDDSIRQSLEGLPLLLDGQWEEATIFTQ